jgi:hypothetical protein
MQLLVYIPVVKAAWEKGCIYSVDLLMMSAVPLETY